MASVRGSKARATALAQRQAAKQKRQTFLGVGAAALLILLLAYEVPHTLKMLNNSSNSSSSSSAAPATTTPATTTPKVPAATKKALKLPPHDVFAARVTGAPTTLGSIATPPGLHDPFAASSKGAAAPVVTPTKTRGSTLPGTIVIGTPGKNKIQEAGWIVILASIPTDQGQSAASDFAAQAGKAGVGQVKVLNSSNRRPLRGGYWVVYTGPFSSLSQVSTASTTIHNKGFTNAYIRQLIVYKAKATAKKTATKKKK